MSQVNDTPVSVSEEIESLRAVAVKSLEKAMMPKCAGIVRALLADEAGLKTGIEVVKRLGEEMGKDTGWRKPGDTGHFCNLIDAKEAVWALWHAMKAEKERRDEYDAMHCQTCGAHLNADAENPHGSCSSCTKRPAPGAFFRYLDTLCDRAATNAAPVEQDDAGAYLITSAEYDTVTGRNDNSEVIGTVEYIAYAKQWAYQLPGETTWNAVFETREAAIQSLRDRVAMFARLTAPHQGAGGRIEQRPDRQYDAFLPGMWCSIGMFDSRDAAAQALATYQVGA